MKNCESRSPDHDHSVDELTSSPPLDDFLSSLQKEFDRDGDSETYQVCSRCNELNFPEMFRKPYQPEYPHLAIEIQRLMPPVYGETIDQVARLGKADTATFLSNCPFCKLLIQSALRFTPGTSYELIILRIETQLLTVIEAPNNDRDINAMVQRFSRCSENHRSHFSPHKGRGQRSTHWESD
jgi:hypothetical protein